MNLLLSVLTILLLWPSAVMPLESSVDVLYLKNGSIIRGEIIELDPTSQVQIRMQDGSIMVYQIDELIKITKEPAIIRSERPPLKNPGAALALSLVIGGITPIQGTGQWYNGEVGKGFGYFVAGMAGLGLLISGISNDEKGPAAGGAIIYLVSWAVGSMDAYSSARRINRENGYEGY